LASSASIDLFESAPTINLQDLEEMKAQIAYCISLLILSLALCHARADFDGDGLNELVFVTDERGVFQWSMVSLETGATTSLGELGTVMDRPIVAK
jgi:hypothetical protein